MTSGIIRYITVLIIFLVTSCDYSCYAIYLGFYSSDKLEKYKNSIKKFI